MKKLSQTKRAIKMREMRATESPSQKEIRLFHNKMLKISSQYLYAKNNSMGLYRKPTEVEKQAIAYRKRYFKK